MKQGPPVFVSIEAMTPTPADPNFESRVRASGDDTNDHECAGAGQRHRIRQQECLRILPFELTAEAAEKLLIWGLNRI